MKKTVLLAGILSVTILCSASHADVQLQFGSRDGEVGYLNHLTHPKQELLHAVGPLSFRANNDEFWLADSVNGRILQIRSNGTIAQSIIAATASQVPIIDFALQPDSSGKTESLWVLCQGTQEVRHIDLTGKLLSTFGGPGPDKTQFLQANRIEWHSSGILFIADKAKQMVSCFSPDGTFLRQRHWEWSGLCIGADGLFYRLQWDQTLKKNRLISEDKDGVVQSEVLLDIPPHKNPKLWNVDRGGNSLITFIPDGGFQNAYGIIHCNSQGKSDKISSLKPPRVMNRFLDVSASGTIYVGEADYFEAPKGDFRIVPFVLK